MTAPDSLQTKQDVLNHPTKWNDVATRRRFREERTPEERAKTLAMMGTQPYRQDWRHLSHYDRYAEDKERDRTARQNSILVGLIWFLGGWQGRNLIRGVYFMRRVRRGWF